jgi:hypothetical protein
MKKYVGMKYPKYNIFVIAYECGRRSHTASVGWKSLAFLEKADHDNNPKIGFDYVVMIT